MAPLPTVVNQLSDPSLILNEANNEKIEKLVLHLAEKYFIEYLIALKKQEYGNENYRGDGDFAILCASDIFSTAALVKEIIFGLSFEKDNADDVSIVDIGSGTGILTIAGIIAGRRKKAENIYVIGVEISQQASKISQQILNTLKREDEHIKIHCGDILAPNRTDSVNIRTTLSRCNPQIIISETISQATPRMRSTERGMEIDTQNPVLKILTDIFLEIQQKTDPFPTIIQYLQVLFPNMYQSVKSQKIALFPDVINGKFTPDFFNSTLTLRTGSNTPDWLCNIANYFRKKYESPEHSSEKRFGPPSTEVFQNNVLLYRALSQKDPQAIQDLLFKITKIFEENTNEEERLNALGEAFDIQDNLWEDIVPVLITLFHPTEHHTIPDILKTNNSVIKTDTVNNKCGAILAKLVIPPKFYNLFHI